MEFQARKSFSAFLEDNPTHRGFHSAPVTPHRSPASPPTPPITPPRRSLQILPHHLSTSPAQEYSPSLLYHCLASFPCPDGAVHAIALAGRGRLVLTGGDSDCVSAMRTRRPRVLALLAHSDGRSKAEHRDEVTCLALFIAGELLYTGSWDRTVKVWHVRDGTCVDSFVAHEGRVNAVAVGQDDGGVFTAGLDGCVKVWRRVYGEKTHALSMVLRFQSSPVNALVIGAGEGYLYSGSSDGYINIWEREAITGRYHHGGFLQGHKYAVLCLAAVERLVLSGSEDTTIRVWRREEGCGFHVCLAVMEGHRGPVRCIAVGVEMENVEGSGIGLLVYSASLDRVLKAWRLKVVGCDDKQLEAEKDKRKAEAVLEEGDVVEPAPERWGVGEESGMNPVLSPLWVEKKTQQTVHLY
ncbi:hypothetical protein KSP40_PGU022170 [Platanthera guangdongensis]|uniref:Uncharacterized protein n=1 Tax=Platanthera guangdongensis TaxID=2320717 RepID=A0ABR2LG99_9ASPA